MMTPDEWKKRWPQAAQELEALLYASSHPAMGDDVGKSETWAQQQARLAIAQAGGMSWRNNVGAMKAKEQHQCPSCHFKFEVKQAPLRWGLCNDSTQLNKRFKSSDLIGIMPVLITPEMVGSTLGQFISVEVKKPGWRYTGNDHEKAQLAWLELVASKGGRSMFSTGAFTLDGGAVVYGVPL